MAHPAGYLTETARIRANRGTAVARAPHPFQPARWTHPNGHPRCRLCGCEERTGGCAGADHDGLVTTTADGSSPTRARLGHGRHVHERDRLLVALLELEGELAVHLAADERGAVPPGARPLHPHETAAATDFDRVAGDVERHARTVLARMQAARADALAVIETWLSSSPSREVLADRIRSLSDPSRILPIGVDLGATIAAAELDYVGLLRAAGIDGGVSVLDELDDQRIPVPGRAALAPTLTADTELDVAGQAARLATIPTGDLIREVAEEWYRLTAIAGDVAAQQAIDAGRSLAPSRLLDHARQATHRAYGRGRTDTAETVPLIATTYASELLDRSTCGPCSFVDGRRYATISAARIDYPLGRYRACQGGDRCRGTLVYVWAAEAPATVQDVPHARPMTDDEVLADLLR